MEILVDAVGGIVYVVPIEALLIFLAFRYVFVAEEANLHYAEFVH